MRNHGFQHTGHGPRLLPPDEALPHRLAAALSSGGVIGIGTDTTYALVASVRSREGVRTLREIRNLPAGRPTTLLFGDLSPISDYAVIDRPSYRLMKRLMEGSYTFILNATKEVPKLLRTKQKTVGVRLPNLPFIRSLIDELDAPLASASAALPGRVGEYASSPDEVASAYPDLIGIVDDGFVYPEPSTVLDLTGSAPVLIREGKGDISFLGGR